MSDPGFTVHRLNSMKIANFFLLVNDRELTLSQNRSSALNAAM